MISFWQLWENMQGQDEIDTGSMKAVRTGLNIRDDFWNDFINVCNNSDALAELLGVRAEQVMGWGSRIKHNIQKVKDADATGDGDGKPKAKVIDTGNHLGGI